MGPMRNGRLRFLDRVVLAFDPAAHVYTWNGQYVPNVTRVLAPLTSYDRIPEHILEHARQEGVAVHKLVELDCYGDLDVETLPEWMTGHYKAWKQFLADTGFEFIASEHRVFHPEFKYAGTLDLAGHMPHAKAKGTSLIDVKRSFFAGASIGLQLSAYAAAWDKAHAAALKIKNRFALKLSADGTYRLQPYEDPNDFSVFLSLLTIERWKAKHGK